VVGGMELNMCLDCPIGICGSAWHSCSCCGCCPGLKAPSGPEWDAAAAGFEPFKEECVKICFDKASSCCCNCPDCFKMKANLDADWTNRANEYLKAHGLKVEVHAFYTSDGKSSTPHLVLQFSKV